MTLLSLAVLVLLFLGYGGYCLWLQHEEDKAERMKYQRIVQANSESVEWPSPLHATPWKAQRKEMA
jgi:hypothetical protein